MRLTHLLLRAVLPAWLLSFLTLLFISLNQLSPATAAPFTPPGSFSISLPSYGSINVPTSPLLVWGASSGALSSEYCYDSNNNTSCDETWISAGVGTPVSLSAGSSY